MEVQKIIWPTDFSSNAGLALSYVQSLTQKYQAEIHVLYVIEDLAHHKGWYGEFEQDHIDKIIEWESKKAGERLEQICSKYLEGCPLYIKHIAVGDPAQEILNLIDKEKAEGDQEQPAQGDAGIGDEEGIDTLKKLQYQHR